jgi:hypothetical protein
LDFSRPAIAATLGVDRDEPMIGRDTDKEAFGDAPLLIQLGDGECLPSQEITEGTTGKARAAAVTIDLMICMATSFLHQTNIFGLGFRPTTSKVS